MLIHRIARTYGRLPHEILDLDGYALGVAVVCMLAADGQAVKDIERAGMVFPAVILGA